MYGLEVQGNPQVRPSVIGEMEITAAGNVVLRVGRVNRLGGIDTSWHQTEHIVLTAQEANRLSSELSQKVGEAASR